MALAPPDELPVYDYRAWIDQEAADTHPDFTIDKLSTSATVSGDTAIVKLDASGTSGSGERQVEVAGRRNVPERTGVGSATRRRSVRRRRAGRSATFVGLEPRCRASSSSRARALHRRRSRSGRAVRAGRRSDSEIGAQASGPVSIQVVRENGRWFVSPVSTVLDVGQQRHRPRRRADLVSADRSRLPPAARRRDHARSAVQRHAVRNLRPRVLVRRHGGSAGRRPRRKAPTPTRRTRAASCTRPTDAISATSTSCPRTRVGVRRPWTLPTTGSYRLVVTGRVAEGRDAHVVRHRSRAEGAARIPTTAAVSGELLVPARRDRARARRTL